MHDVREASEKMWKGFAGGKLEPSPVIFHKLQTTFAMSSPQTSTAESSAPSWASRAATAAGAPPDAAANSPDPVASTSATPSTSAASGEEPRIDELVLDAGPLLAQLPLRGLAKKYYIPPSVMAELKDKRAREHLEFLKISGLDFEVREAGAEALAAVIAFAKQTGDYSVLSRPDLSVLALAYAVEVERHGTWRIRSELGGKTGQQAHEAERVREGKRAAGKGRKEEGVAEAAGATPTSAPAVAPAASSSSSETDVPADQSAPHDGNTSDVDDGNADGDASGANEEEIAAAIAKMDLASSQQRQQPADDATSSRDAEDDEEGWTTVPSSSRRRQQEEVDYGGSDGEGEWITGDNITKQKHKDLGLVTDEALTAMRGGESASGTSVETRKNKKKSKGKGRMTVATMTADYAVQNVLLQMGMALVSTEGYRIERVRSWVLRCHACFKLCKDSERKFCPECGNPSLIRTSVTSQAPGSSTAHTTSSGLQVHLKKNFQYKTRGNIYSLPMPKPGSASSGKDPRKAVPILREDQAEWQRGLAREQVRKNKEQKALERALEKGKDTISARYEDPDWLPGMMLAGDSRKDSYGLPDIGAGRRNPNQAKHGRRRK